MVYSAKLLYQTASNHQIKATFANHQRLWIILVLSPTHGMHTPLVVGDGERSSIAAGHHLWLPFGNCNWSAVPTTMIRDNQSSAWLGQWRLSWQPLWVHGWEGKIIPCFCMRMVGCMSRLACHGQLEFRHCLDLHPWQLLTLPNSPTPSGHGDSLHRLAHSTKVDVSLLRSQVHHLFALPFFYWVS